MRPNRPLLIISIVLTVFFLAAAILIAIKGQAYPMPTGNEITSYFVVARCKHELYNELSTASLLLAFASITCIGASFKWNGDPANGGKIYGARTLLPALMIVLFAVYSCGSEIYYLKTETPRIEVASVTGHIYHKGYYRLRMSNGEVIRVNYNTYKSHNEGAKFYILMCGDECVSAYPIEEYTLGA